MKGPSTSTAPEGCLLISCLLLGASACTAGTSWETAMCALVDASGTYTEEMPAVEKIIRTGILPELVPGDSLFLIGIDSDSYDEENLWASLTLDRRPSRANAQKLAFAEEVGERLERVDSARLTDISGAMMLCSDYLKGTGAGTELMLVLSDLQEELAEGQERSFAAGELSSVDVVALNVIRLRRDNVQPASYRERLATWEERVLAAGARSWEVLADASNLPELIQARRGER